MAKVVKANSPVFLYERITGKLVARTLTESDGSCIETLLSERFCRRFPPSATEPQAKRLVKLAALTICWVEASGSRALRRCTKPLLV